MEYLSVAEARQAPGLKLVLSAHVPGPWGEAAKAVLGARKVSYIPVAQAPLQANDDLVAWTGIRNAPIAVPDEGPAISGWLDFVFYAEQFGSGPSILPDRPEDRAVSIGISAEICAPYGFGWMRRLLMFQRSIPAGAPDPVGIRRQYGYSSEAAAPALSRLLDILRMLDARLATQRAAGSEYLVGDRLGACDLHWACFSMMVSPLSPENAPALSPELRARYGDVEPEVAAALTANLMTHRDMIFSRHIGLPLDF